jgi:hypothetical protein
MHEAYSDDFASVAVGDRDRLIPAGVRKLAGAAVFLGVVAAMGLWSYRLGTRDAAEVPVIRAMEGPGRIQPEDPGGAQAAHQGLEVNTVLSGVPAPVARTPVAPIQAGPVLAEEDAPQGALIVAAARAFAEPAEDAGADLRMPPSEDGIETVVVGESPDLGSLVAEALGPEAEATTPEAGAEPGARPLRRPGNLVRVRAQAPAATTAATSPATTAPPAAAAPAREVASLGSGSRLVQLGAYDSEQSTRQAWSQLVARHGDLFAGKSLYVERATSNSRVFYRLRVAGFANTEQTRVMCEQLRARGIDCIPVTLQ